MDLATLASGATDGLTKERDVSLRERLRLMLDRKGVLPPPPEHEPEPEPQTVDIVAIARAEEEEMKGYHGLTVDGASGMQMFYTGNTLSDKKRKEKRQQFRVVHFYIELARKADMGMESSDASEKKLSPLQATVADLLFNSSTYTSWLCAVCAVHMCLSFWEPAHIGAPNVIEPPTPWFRATVEFLCIAAYVGDAVLQSVAHGWRAYLESFYSKLCVLCIGAFTVDLILRPALQTSLGGFSRFLRPVIVLARHARLRSEIVLLFRCAARSRAPVTLLLAIITVSAVFGLVLLKTEYGNLSVGTAASVGDFTNFHRAWITLYSLVSSADSYHLVYLFRGYPALSVARPLATVFVAGVSALLFVVATNAVSLLYDNHKDEVERRTRVYRTRARHWLSIAFKNLDDRDKGYISVEKLRYFLATAYPAVPFEPIAQKLRHNVEEQSGLLDFFDFCSVMDMVIAHRDPDAVLFYSTHKWHTLPLVIVLLNGSTLALHGTIKDAAALDSVNAFFIFLYAVEIGTKIFAIRPTRFWRSSCNRFDAILVIAAIVAQVTRIVTVIEHLAAWRAVTALPMLRVFSLVSWLRRPLVDCFGSTVDVFPAISLVLLISYTAAVVGSQCFAGQVAVESGYPVRTPDERDEILHERLPTLDLFAGAQGQFLSFDSFDSAVLVLLQVAIGGWSRVLLGGVGSSYNDDQIAEATAAGRVEILPGSTPLVTWYLIGYRALTLSTFAQVCPQLVCSTRFREAASF
eukprot:SAG11_NODE_742_length_7408_cov_21.226023_6_plen_746_part_00